ncbi:MAG TPA: sigma-54-dependent Fis family transcriptional regulator [Nitrospirae bacterium]|nr:sigma-54-dependent Fis family transcriptional regulator [Nitrospirota bacterium]
MFSQSENTQITPIVGSSKAIKEIYEIISRVLNTDSTVLILGESGTGKELIAKTIHYGGQRANKPFIHVNCAAIPSELLESELFGYEKGAFTGAFNSRLGKFEMAKSGTILLDEIGDMPPQLQAKILRVLQERSFERIGGMKTITVDVRIIAATNKNLQDIVAQGKFREDLFYRLNVIPITMPPLRNRTEDIPELCEYFIEKFNKKFNKTVGISNSVYQYFKNYSWPGNVRELENLIERLFVLKEDNMIIPSDLPEGIRNGGIPEIPDFIDDDTNPFINGIDLNAALKAYEKRLIIHALDLHEGIKARAAKYLNIKRTSLIEKMKRYGITSTPSEK